MNLFEVRIKNSKFIKNNAYCIIALMLILSLTISAAAYYDPPIKPMPGIGSKTKELPWWDWQWTTHPILSFFGDWDFDGRVETWEIILSVALLLIPVAYIARALGIGAKLALIGAKLGKFAGIFVLFGRWLSKRFPTLAVILEKIGYTAIKGWFGRRAAGISARWLAFRESPRYGAWAAKFVKFGRGIKALGGWIKRGAIKFGSYIVKPFAPLKPSFLKLSSFVKTSKPYMFLQYLGGGIKTKLLSGIQGSIKKFGNFKTTFLNKFPSIAKFFEKGPAWNTLNANEKFVRGLANFEKVELLRLFGTKGWNMATGSHTTFNEYTFNIFNNKLPVTERLFGLVWWGAEDLMLYTGGQYAWSGAGMFKKEMLYRLGMLASEEGSPIAFRLAMIPNAFKSLWGHLSEGKVVAEAFPHIRTLPASVLRLATWEGLSGAARIGHICAVFNLPISTAMSLYYNHRLPTLSEYIGGYREGWVMGTAFGGIVEVAGPWIKPFVQRIPVMNRATLIAPENLGSFSKYLEQYSFSNRAFNMVVEEMIREEVAASPFTGLSRMGVNLYGYEGWSKDGRMPGWGETFQESFDPMGRGRPTKSTQFYGMLADILGNYLFGSGKVTGQQQAFLNGLSANKFESFEIKNALTGSGFKGSTAAFNNIGRIFTAFSEGGYSPVEAVTYAINRNFKNTALELEHYKGVNIDGVLRTGSLGLSPETTAKYSYGVMGANKMSAALNLPQTNFARTQIPFTELNAANVNFASIENFAQAGFAAPSINEFYSAAGPNTYISLGDISMIKNLQTAGYKMSEIGSFFSGAGNIEVSLIDIPQIKQFSAAGINMGEIGAIYGRAGAMTINTARVPLVLEMHSAGFTGVQIGDFFSAAGTNFQVTKMDIPVIQKMLSAGISMQDIGRLYDLQNTGVAQSFSVQNRNINSANVDAIINVIKAPNTNIKNIGLLLNTGMTAPEISSFQNSMPKGFEIPVQDSSSLALMVKKGISASDTAIIYNTFTSGQTGTVEFNYVDVSVSIPTIKNMQKSGMEIGDIAGFYKGAGGNIGVVTSVDIKRMQPVVSSIGGENAGKLYNLDVKTFYSNIDAATEMSAQITPQKAAALMSNAGLNAVKAYQTNPQITVSLVNSIGPAQAAQTINTYTAGGKLDISQVELMLKLADINAPAASIAVERFGAEKTISNIHGLTNLFKSLGAETGIFLLQTYPSVISAMNEYDAATVIPALTAGGNTQAASKFYNEYYSITGKTIGSAGISKADVETLGKISYSLGPIRAAKTLFVFMQRLTTSDAINLLNNIVTSLGTANFVRLTDSPTFQSSIQNLKTLDIDSVSKLTYKQIAYAFAASDTQGLNYDLPLPIQIRQAGYEYQNAFFTTALNQRRSSLEAGGWQNLKQSLTPKAKDSLAGAMKYVANTSTPELDCFAAEKFDETKIRQIMVNDILPVIASVKGLTAQQISETAKVFESLKIENSRAWGAHHNRENNINTESATLYAMKLGKETSTERKIAALFAFLHEAIHLVERTVSDNIIRDEESDNIITDATRFGEGFASTILKAVAYHLYQTTGNTLYLALGLTYYEAGKQRNEAETLWAKKEKTEYTRNQDTYLRTILSGNVIPYLSIIQEELGLDPTDPGHYAPAEILEESLKLGYIGDMSALFTDMLTDAEKVEALPKIEFRKAVEIIKAQSEAPETSKPTTSMETTREVRSALRTLLLEYTYSIDEAMRNIALTTIQGIAPYQKTFIEQGVHEFERDYPGIGRILI